MVNETHGDEFDSMHFPPFWYGFANIFLSTSFLIVTILVTAAIRHHECYSKWSSYQIMFYISLCDMAQLIAQEFSGVSLMLEWEMPNLLNIFLGSIMSGSWISASVYAILLALHRLFSVVFPILEMNYFKGRNKRIMLSTAHSTFLFFTILQWTKWSHYTFSREEFSWDYEKSLPLGEICSAIDDFSVVPFILCSVVCYSMIFYTLRTKGTNKKAENAITLHVFIYCLLCAFIFILWRFLEPIFEPKPIVYFWTSLPWMFYNGANAVICLCFNRSIRRNVLKLLQCRWFNQNRTAVKLFSHCK